MSWASVLIQFLNGLAGASSLFLLAAGLSLIFGVTRVVNFAHGSLYMLGMYLAVSLSGPLGFWLAVPLAAAAVAAVGFVIEIAVLRRIYKAPELLQLLATFALFLVMVVGGLGSIPGAFLAALLIAQAKAFCIGLGFSKATLVVEFIVMAAVLVIRPWGLLGRAQAAARNPDLAQSSLGTPGKKFL